MSNQQRSNSCFTLLIDEDLLGTAIQRSAFSGRSRNQELVHLLRIGLQEYRNTGAEARSVDVKTRRTTLYIDENLLDEVREYATATTRSVGKALNLLVRLALQQIINREVAIIASMVSRDQENLVPARIVTHGSQHGT